MTVAGQLPTGCVPIILTLFQSSNTGDYEANTGCLKKYNDLAFYHNLLLRQELMQLRGKYPHVKLSYTNYYDPVINMVKSPNQFGKSLSSLCIQIQLPYITYIIACLFVFNTNLVTHPNHFLFLFFIFYILVFSSIGVFSLSCQQFYLV